MRIGRALVAAGVVAAGVRVAHSRTRRFLHPDGRSFTGELEVWGLGAPTGAALLDRPGRHPVTLRISRGAGTPPGYPDVLGVAVRVHGPVAGRRHDLLFSTAGRGRWTRHLPAPRFEFDTLYGSLLPYRTGTGRKLYLAVQPDLYARALGRTLESVVAAARHDGARLMLTAATGSGPLRPAGRIHFGQVLPAGIDAALAFDPVRNVPADLHPTGLIHASRAPAYRLGQRWRGARPAEPDQAAVARTATHG
ncbi:hypothetical protein [Pseudosporangium ferrugineum]|uniref:Phosphodiesterase n=1 Tax=Pseudosporangium ferrugineum TaxID=439699 RepID=A0A2T0S2K8_9ACTN|nr:hypothetical protein [Pseudosporangium ferrugineum]PRY27658.1 hypothetical protein CLV70_110245 [Pseudosporangium ferrugineum]